MPATKPYKAAAAFILTFIASFLALVQDKTEFDQLSTLQWLIALLSALVTAGVVYGVNNPPTGTGN